MSILNLTQHISTPEQLEAGVVEPIAKDVIQHYLTFEELPTQEVINLHVSRLVSICERWKSRKIELLQHATQQSDAIPYTLMEVHEIMRPDVMIGGAPFLMEPLATALKQSGFNPVYAFSRRESIETVINGEVIKTSKFIHQGFVGI
jgi:hypothetical protein